MPSIVYNFVHAFDTNVDACRWKLKLMRAHSLLTKVTSVELYYTKSRHVHSVRTNLLIQIAIFVPMAVIKQQVRSYNQSTQQNRDSYFKKKNTCFKQKIAWNK
jgi:hypothetical protein